MRNEGFTLVELLAVIAILAILVIVAMPNVLGMFNDAKVNIFVTDVQKIIDAATTAFTKDALSNAGKTVYYSSVDNATLKTKKLDMSGAEKEYFIEIDRNGKFKRVVVYDSNYCYDVYAQGGNGNLKNTKSKFILDDIDKTSVILDDVWESGDDSVSVLGNASEYVVNGCESISNVFNKEIKVISIYCGFNLFGNYYYEDGMTWGEWIDSKYNVDHFVSEYGPIFIEKYVISNRLNYVCNDYCHARYDLRENDGRKYFITEVIDNTKFVDLWYELDL